MKNFDEIKFIFTEDSSVGLYSNKVNDIFHSRTGALKEAYEKFIYPIIDNSFNCKTVLDICYGIGYNTKSLLTNYYNNNLIIDALEFDKTFVSLSAFIQDSINDFDLNEFILYQLIENKIDIKFLVEVLFKMYNNEYIKFLSPYITNFLSNNKIDACHLSCEGELQAFLHNIYYNYISNNINNSIKSNKYNKCKINFYFDDARINIKSLDNIYDAVFLDAFSSQKDPTLWTINFLRLVKSKMHQNSLLLSYSKATPFRSALLELGFNVGKIFIDGKDMGTIASLNSKYIKNCLTDFDYALINTRSGIVYKDDNLNLTPKEILQNREFEAKISNRISHTQFLKENSKQNIIDI